MEEEKLKIGTHNSATGEKSYWLTIPLIPFTRTQNKTILEQHKAGCRLFDIRAKYAFGKWRACSGGWVSSKSIEEFIKTLNKLSYYLVDPIELQLTYVGSSKYAYKFRDQVKIWRVKYQSIIWNNVKAEYNDTILHNKKDTLLSAEKAAHNVTKAYLPLDFYHWQTIIPIPWLWKKFYFTKVNFDSKKFKLVDFL